MLPLDLELVKIIATHLMSVREGLEEGFLSVTLAEGDDTDPAHIRAMLIQTENYLIDALERAAVEALQAAEAAQQQVVLTKDNVLMFPTETIEA